MNQKRILIVDDCRTTAGLMEKLVRKLEGCEPVTYLDPAMFVDAMDTEAFDVAIIDHMMPNISGIEIVRRLQAHHKHSSVPVIMITADRESGLRLKAFESGVIEFLNKPIEPIEFRARIRNLLRLREAQHRAEDTASWLDVEIDNITRKIREREEEFVQRLSVIDNSDSETASRLLRIAAISKRLAAELGHDEAFCSDIRLAAMMQDFGAAAARGTDAESPAPLTRQRQQQEKMKVLIGQQASSIASVPLMRMADAIAVFHRERWDGRGYPRGLAGEEIPVSARIVAVADALDALTSRRMYKEAWSVTRTVDYLRSEGGKRFDPQCVAALETCIGDVEALLVRGAEAPGEPQPAAVRKVA